MRALYSIHYVDTKGRTNVSRYFTRLVNAQRNAKFNIGKSASIHDNSKIARATVYRDNIPVSVYGETDPIGPVDVDKITEYGLTQRLPFSIRVF